LKRKQEMLAQKVASPMEVEEAALDAELAQAKIAVANEEKNVKQLDADAKAASIQQMKMTSPIDGEIEKIDTSVGELADQQKPSITLVQNDPLYVMMNLPNEMAARLTSGETMDVRYNENEQWQKATVDVLSPSANPEAFKRIVKLKLSNSGHKNSGEKIFVRLPEKLQAVETAGVR